MPADALVLQPVPPLLVSELEISRYSAAAQGKISSAIKRISGWLKNWVQYCCGITNKRDYGPAFGDCPHGQSAIGPIGDSHWSWLATITYVAEIFFVQFRLTL